MATSEQLGELGKFGMAASKPRHAGRKQKSRARWWIYGSVLVAFVAAGVVFVPAFQFAGKRPMPPCLRNLRMIGLALQCYHEDYGHFPPASAQSREGKPIHSWRVLILPYLADLHEADARWLKDHRYDFGLWESRDFRAREKTARKKAEQIHAVVAAYDFTEPWNGPSNQPLSDKILDAFCCNHNGSHAATDYLAVVGDQTAWPEGHVTRSGDFLDGLSNTILVVEAIGSDIHWSEPRDLHFESMSFVVNDADSLGIKGPFPDAANVLVADGSVRALYTNVAPVGVKALLTINGQEKDVPW